MRDRLLLIVEELITKQELYLAESLLLVLLDVDGADPEVRLFLVKTYRLMAREDRAKPHAEVYVELIKASASKNDANGLEPIEILEKADTQKPTGHPLNINTGAPIDNEFEKLYLSARHKADLRKIIQDAITLAWDEQVRPPLYLRDPRYDHFERNRKEQLTSNLSMRIHSKKMFEEAKAFTDWRVYLLDALKTVTVEGFYLEFGVYKGSSLNFMAQNHPELTFHGFDSFLGLPEKWGAYAPGHLSLGGEPPMVERNVELHIGWFNETLPCFFDDHDGSIAFAHIDSDLKSSATTALKGMYERLRAGTVIVFDEYLGEESEAFQEFVNETNIEYRYLSYHLHEKNRIFYTPHSVAVVLEKV